MTLLSGKAYIVETEEQFCRRLGVTGAEILAALDDSDQEAILKEYAAYEDCDRVETVRQLPDWVTETYSEFLTAIGTSTNEMIQAVLEARDMEYIHLYDGTVHTVVEIH